MKTYNEQAVNYDVSGGDANFDSLVFEGNNFLAVQFFYTSLNQADHKIKLQESIDKINYVDSLDSSGSAIEMTINNALANDILKVYNYNTVSYRFQFIEGTAGTGTIDKLIIVTE